MKFRNSAVRLGCDNSISFANDSKLRVLVILFVRAVLVVVADRFIVRLTTISNAWLT